MEAARSKAALHRQLAQVGAPPALSLSAQEAARLQGFVDGEEVRAKFCKEASLLPPFFSGACPPPCVRLCSVASVSAVDETRCGMRWQ